MRREDLLIISNVTEPDATARLKELINRSIITSDVQEMRYALVPLVSDFLRVRKPQVLRETGDRLEEHVYQLVGKNGFEHHDRFPVLDEAWPTVAAALPRFLAGENGRLHWVCNALASFLEFTGRWDEQLALSCDAESRAVEAGDFVNAGWRAQQAGWVHNLREQSAEVLACADRSEDHWRKAKVGARERATGIRLRGRGQLLAGNYTAAIAAYRDAVELWRTEGSDTQDVAIGLNALAGAEQMAGDYDAAERDYREAQRINQIVGNQEGVAIVTCNLAAMALDRTDWATAEELAREALNLSELVGRLGFDRHGPTSPRPSPRTTGEEEGSALARRARCGDLPNARSAGTLPRSAHTRGMRELRKRFRLKLHVCVERGTDARMSA